MSFLPSLDSSTLNRVQLEERLSEKHDGDTSLVSLGQLELIKKRYYSSDASKTTSFKDVFRRPNYHDLAPIYYFNKLATILAVSELLGKNQFTPSLYGVDKSEYSVYMERCLQITYKDLFNEGNNKKRKTEFFLSNLNDLHKVFGDHFEYLYKNVAWSNGKTLGLRARTGFEERERIKNYLRSIVYLTSSKFEDYYLPLKEKFVSQIKDHKKRKKVVNQFIDDFLKENKIDLDYFVNIFVKNDRIILYGHPDGLDNLTSRQLYNKYKCGKINIVMGDYNTSNVFVNDTPLICDPDEMRIDSRTIDVVSALYDFQTAPNSAEDEVSHFSLIREYSDRVIELEKSVNSRINSNVLAQEFLIESLETRLKNGLRLFAIDCHYTTSEMRNYVKHLPEFNSINDNDLPAVFLENMFIKRFQKFEQFVLGEAFGIISEFPNANLLKDQILALHDFYKSIGVIEKPTPSSKRRSVIAETYKV